MTVVLRRLESLHHAGLHVQILGLVWLEASVHLVSLLAAILTHMFMESALALPKQKKGLHICELKN